MITGYKNSETSSETLGRVFKNMTGTSLLLSSSKKDKLGSGPTLNCKELDRTPTVRTEVVKAAKVEKQIIRGQKYQIYWLI